VPTISADEVRIPRHIREAVARHEAVVVLNRERPVLAIVHPDDLSPAAPARRGRPLREVLDLLARAPSADAAFADDMEQVLESVGPAPSSPWDHS
jgi:hypothetical protein